MVTGEKSWERVQSYSARIVARVIEAKIRMSSLAESGFGMLEARRSNSWRVSGKMIDEVVGWRYWHRYDEYLNVMIGVGCRPHHGAVKRLQPCRLNLRD
jgi:hypothetical protein